MRDALNLLRVCAGVLLSSGVAVAADGYAAPVRPSTPTAQADLSMFEHLTSPVSPVGGTMLTLALAMLAVVVVATCVALRSAGVMRAEGTSGWSWTLSAKVVALGGFLMAIVAIFAVIFTHVNRLNSQASVEYERVLERVALMERFDRAALEARIHARGFLLFERNEDVTLFLNSYTEAGQTLEFIKKLTQDQQESARLDDIEQALGHYGSVITRAVGLTDKIAEISRGRIEPTTRRLANSMATLTGLGESDRRIMQITITDAGSQVLQMIASNSGAGADALAESLRGHERSLGDLARAASRDADERARIEEAAGLMGTMARDIAELGGVIDQRFDVIFKQCPPSGTKLGELAHEANGEIKKRVAAMGAEPVSRADRLLGVALMLIAASLILAGGFSAAMIAGIRRQMNGVIASAERIGRGDLRPTQAGAAGRDEFGLLQRLMDKIAESLRSTLGEVARASTAVSGGAGEIQASSRNLSSDLDKCEQQTQQVSAAIEELSSSVGSVLQQSRDALAAAESSGTKAQRGGEVVGQTIGEMRAIADQVDASARSISELGKKSEEIGRIIGVINDIADQTNLLALNAAIEAARAGEHGRGFAVVADEVRKLAERTTHATKEVAQSIRDIQDRTGEAVSTIQQSSGRVGKGVELASEAGSSLHEIVGGSDSLRSMVQTIATASDQQSQASADVARSVGAIAELSRSLSTSAQQTRSIAEAFTRQAGALDAAISRFKL